MQDQEDRQFTFNGDNKQTEVKGINDSIVGRYFYDGEGKRVKKITNTEMIVYVYSNGRQIAEYSTGATPPANPTTNYTATDMLGSPRVLTDSLGNVVSRRDFLPFGEELYADGTHRSVAGKYSQTGQDGVRQRFTGYEKDLETGLDFALARMYENRYGRFTAIDPLLASGKSANPQTFNRYVYVLNNPLLLTDPTGLQAATDLSEKEKEANRRAVEEVNNAAGAFTERDTTRFEEARDNAVRMVAEPADKSLINPCREAILKTFGNADPVTALKELVATGGIAALNTEGRVVEGPQNVFNGATTTYYLGSGSNAQLAREYFKDHPRQSAVHDPNTGFIFLSKEFFSGRGDLGRAQDTLHETLVHRANGRKDSEFAPTNSKNPTTEGSLKINEIIQRNCGSLTPLFKKREEDKK